jgi:hypothetical protein
MFFSSETGLTLAEVIANGGGGQILCVVSSTHHKVRIGYGLAFLGLA